MKSRTCQKARFCSLDLFCGCGGLSLGLRRAGFNVLAAIDSDELSVETYRKNHKRTLLINQDIRTVKTLDLMKRLKLQPGDLDLLAGCPPCQGFSRLRTFNGARTVDEPMNDLVFQFLRFVQAFSTQDDNDGECPGAYGRLSVPATSNRLTALKYKFHAKALDAAKYGVAQRRQRMILLALAANCLRSPRQCAPGAPFPSYSKAARARRINGFRAQLFRPPL